MQIDNASKPIGQHWGHLLLAGLKMGHRSIKDFDGLRNLKAYEATSVVENQHTVQSVIQVQITEL
jgi:hypothetical protein